MSSEPGNLPATASLRRVRSYVLRGGRTTAGQERALSTLWPQFGIDHQEVFLDLARQFGREAPRTLEIGFGNGANLLARAIAEPGRDFLGIEVHRAGVGQLLAGLAQAGLGNVRLMRHDAVEVVRQALAPECFDEVQVLFPDPWPKARHHKRRLLQPAFVDALAQRLNIGGVLHLATDWEPYAVEMLEVLRACPLLESTCGAEPWSARPAHRALTRFEQRGLRRGHEVRDLVWRRRDERGAASVT